MFFEAHMFFIIYGLFHIHIATLHSFTPGRYKQSCTAGRRDSEADKMHLCGGCWGWGCPSYVSLHYSPSALPAKRGITHANRISRHLFTSPGTGGDKWNQYLGCHVISLSRRRPQVYITAHLYSAELIMKHIAELLTWKIGNYVQQSAVLVE